VGEANNGHAKENAQRLMVSFIAFPQITHLPITTSSDCSLDRGGKQI
jgi:hypothetical protein